MIATVSAAAHATSAVMAGAAHAVGHGTDAAWGVLAAAWPAVPPGSYDPSSGHGPDWGKAAPAGLLIWLFMGVCLFFLIKSMNKHMRRVPDSFDTDEGGGSADSDATGEVGASDDNDASDEGIVSGDATGNETTDDPVGDAEPVRSTLTKSESADRR